MPHDPSPLRRTKIVTTLGPATDDPDVLRALLEAGADVVRINCSHGDLVSQRPRVEAVREASDALGLDVAILADLQGPKIRVERFAEGAVTLEDGATFTLDTDLDPSAGDVSAVGITYQALPDDVTPGDVLLLSDGQIELDVIAIEGRKVVCRVRSGGRLRDRKGLNRRGGGLSAASLTDDDRENIRTAAEYGIDYLAVSFPKDGADVETARRLFKRAGGNGRIIAKVERTEAIEHIESIVRAADVVMVARGDLGVEMGFASVPGLQKRILYLTRTKARVAITATQMMESMIEHPLPTRAEVSDVANAVMDGTDAVMLSAETAIGQHPVEAVRAMAAICVKAERHLSMRGLPSHRMDDRFERVDEAIAMAVMYTANHLDVAAIIAFTESGSTARWMSRIRSDIPIFALTRHASTRRRVQIFRNVHPVPFDMRQLEVPKLYDDAIQTLRSRGVVTSGDRVIVTKGDRTGVAGGTNAMKILAVP